MSSVPHTLDAKTRELIPKSKVLVVGAGGIGCEVIKNLALSGFHDIEIVNILFPGRFHTLTSFNSRWIWTQST